MLIVLPKTKLIKLLNIPIGIDHLLNQLKPQLFMQRFPGEIAPPNFLDQSRGLLLMTVLLELLRLQLLVELHFCVI